MFGHNAMPRVGFWLRVAASLVDVLVILPLIGVYVAVLWFLEENGRLTSTIEYLIDVSVSVLAVAYSSLEIFTAGTPGKRILHLRIADASGHAADAWKLANRWVTKNTPTLVGLLAAVTTVSSLEVVSNLLSVVVLIAFLGAAGESRQAWYDRRAGTAVYRTRDLQERRGFEALASRGDIARPQSPRFPPASAPAAPQVPAPPPAGLPTPPAAADNPTDGGRV